MMSDNPKYMLVVDATAAQVEKILGLRGINTPCGALVPQPGDWFDIAKAMAIINRAIKPIDPNRCICGPYAVIHRAGCPASHLIT